MELGNITPAEMSYDNTVNARPTGVSNVNSALILSFK